MFSQLVWISLFLLDLLSFAAGRDPLSPREDYSVGMIGGCGNEPADEDVQVAEQSFQKDLVLLSSADAALGSLEFDVYFHIVTANATVEGGWIPNEQIDAQINVLNDDYADVGITWRRVATTRIISKDWFEGITQDSADANLLKMIFRQGGVNALNVFTVGFPNSTLLGYSTFPWTYRTSPNLDGVIIRHSTLPGGFLIDHNLGRTLTHEAGHWLGLFHTFQGGCTDPGDLVADTPPVSMPNFGCPVGRDSCPGGGVDPINNFMDYTDDGCKTGFTPGQITRIQSATQLYRSVV